MATEQTQTKKVGSVFDLPRKSYEIVKANWQLFAIVNILTLLSAIPPLFGNNGPDSRYESFGTNGLGISGEALGLLIGFSFIAVIVGILVAIFLQAMGISLGLRTTNGEKPTFDQLVDVAKKYWLRLLALEIVMGIIIVIGLILLIIPGLFAIYRLMFAPYLLIERDLSIEESLKASNELVKNNAGPALHVLLLFVGLSILSGIIGSIPNIGALLSALFSIAISLVVLLRYRELRGKLKV